MFSLFFDKNLITANWNPWQMIREREDLHFFMPTKRIERFFVSLPEDRWAGYANPMPGYATAGGSWVVPGKEEEE